MIIYLLKSTACLAILLTFYYLLLEKEKMHRFKRFYLLFSLFFALGVPFIQIESRPDVVPVLELNSGDREAFEPAKHLTVETSLRENASDLPEIIAVLYGIGMLLMGFRFIKNLLWLKSSIAANSHVPYKNARLVLLNEPLLPYTFLHYIFVNKNDYENQQIESELLTHELAHVRQKHSLDILFIKALQIVFWFNPLIYLYERAIKLNHEFLADEYVIKACKDISAYQLVLLQKVFSSQNYQLTSNLNYSLTKTRLIMMTKNSSQISTILKRGALIPLLAVMVFSFSARTQAQEASKDETTQNNSSPAQAQHEPSVDSDSLRQVKEIIYQTATFRRKNNKGEVVEKSFEDLTEEEIDELPVPGPPRELLPTQDQLKSWMDADQYGVWIDGKRVDNSLLKNYEPADFGKYYVSRLHKNAANYGEHSFQVDLSTREYFEDFKRSWLERFAHIE